MYRKPGSTMTAVETVSAMFDGPIPHDVLIEARAEDARFVASHAERIAAVTAADEARMMVGYYAEKVRRLMSAKKSKKAAGREITPAFSAEIVMWFCEWRKERRRLNALLSAASQQGAA
jgi:hypothetical protein